MNNFLLFRSTEIECCCFFVIEYNIETESTIRPTNIVLFSTSQNVDDFYLSDNRNIIWHWHLPNPPVLGCIIPYSIRNCLYTDHLKYLSFFVYLTQWIFCFTLFCYCFWFLSAILLFYCFTWLKGHWKPRNEVRFLSPLKCSVGFELLIFWLQCNIRQLSYYNELPLLPLYWFFNMFVWYLFFKLSNQMMGNDGFFWILSKTCSKKKAAENKVVAIQNSHKKKP